MRTVWLGLGVGSLCVALALPLAWLTHATDLPGRRFFRFALNLPLAVPSYVAGFVVIATFAAGGWLQTVLGIENPPEIYGVFGVTLALLFTYPFALLPLQAALTRTDPRLWESARSLGAGPWRTFFRVIFPDCEARWRAVGCWSRSTPSATSGASRLLRFHSLSFLIYLRYRSLFDRNEAVFLSLLLAGIASGLRRCASALARTLHARSLESWSEPPVANDSPWLVEVAGICVLLCRACVRRRAPRVRRHQVVAARQSGWMSRYRSPATSCGAL